MVDRYQTIVAQRYPVLVDDGCGFLPDQIAFVAPVGMRADLRRAATEAGMSCSAFIRVAIVEKLSCQAAHA